ncbi:MAG TPA: hypothetical protein VM452_02190 [Caulifigura sp.]|jgi:hypothetical protein|nr:hypothetical protein [Caulifigura sp.]
MADTHDPVETGMPKTVRYGIAAVLVILVFMWFLPRRAGNNGTTPGSDESKEPVAASSSERAAEQQLSGILSGLSPERVAITSERLDRLAELSQWSAETLVKGDAAAVTLDEGANAKWFAGDALKKVNEPSFSLRDTHHITMALLASEMATRVKQKFTEPVDQIDELFRTVILETVLMPDDFDSKLPGTPFESLMLGRATAAGRAWVFATLLRQLPVDAVILEPKSKPEAWLIGVLAPSGDVLLYDPRLGTCVPSGPAPAGFQKPASLALVKQKPELLRELDVSTAAYPLQADDLKAFHVRLIADSSGSALRMAKLQTRVDMEVFDGVGKSSLREKGLAERVIAAGNGGGWSEADVAVWSYPEQQADVFMSSGAEESRAWKQVTEVFLGPMILTDQRLQTKGESDVRTKPIVAKSDEPLRKVRMEHLSGRYETALRNYGRIRGAYTAVTTRDPELVEQLRAAMPLNGKAAEYAVYWIALCQLREKPQIVPGTLEGYIRLFPKGEMLNVVPDLWATSIEESGDKAAAVKFLEGGQRTPRREILIKQWAEGAKAEKSKDAAPTEKPETPAAPVTEPASAPAAAPGGT